MNRSFTFLCKYFLLVFALPFASFGQTAIRYDQTRPGFLVFHPIKTDGKGQILPWYHNDPAIAYNHILHLTWNFWDTMRTDLNGLPYYMNHQVWRPGPNDPRGLGGDQLNMALSSFRLLYQYTGNERVKENMKFMAEYYATHSLSPDNAAWPHMPYPYNSFVYAGTYDGDMVIGKYFTQPDKAGSFGYELLQLYKMIYQPFYGHATEEIYLDYAIKIANTLAAKTQTGDNDQSPLPFKVNAITGDVGILKSNRGDGSKAALSSYTTNWAATLRLWEELRKMKKGDTLLYKTAHGKILDWMKKYPLKTNKWGPFFEDIPGWSDTQINAITFAQYIMDHPAEFPDWQKNVKGIFDWVYAKLGNKDWEKYGVIAVNEQTAYQTPGNSHTARQAAAELQYAFQSGDNSQKAGAIRKLNWATYMVDKDGKNCYPRDEVWLTDGYGDYIRHYLKAMGFFPELVPAKPHLIGSSSVVAQADYAPDINKKLAPNVTAEEAKTLTIYYRTFDKISTETIRLARKPTRIIVDRKELPEGKNANSWNWVPLGTGGYVQLRKNGYAVKMFE